MRLLFLPDSSVVAPAMKKNGCWLTLPCISNPILTPSDEIAR